MGEVRLQEGPVDAVVVEEGARFEAPDAEEVPFVERGVRGVEGVDEQEQGDGGVDDAGWKPADRPAGRRRSEAVSGREVR